MIDEFKKFILKGNVVDLSTGVIIGASFGEIVKAFTTGIVNPLLSLLGGKPDVSLRIAFGKATLDLGVVISAALGFLITAAVVFFVIVKPINKLVAMTTAKEAAAPPPGPTPTEVLLTEIRDALKK